MSQPIQIRLGGYSPPTTSFSKALKLIGDRMTEQFGDSVDVKYVWNILDLGFRGEDTLWLAESGVLSMCYQSTSYLVDRVPELGFVDLPFLMASNEHAHAAIDGALGQYLIERIEAQTNYRVLGFLENGFRHISNRLRPIRSPEDFQGMSLRCLPSPVQARTFELLGATPRPIDLSDAIKQIVEGTLDAQENPLFNTVTYGVTEYHRYHSLTGHFYVSRGLFMCRDQFDSWPQAVQDAMRAAVREAVIMQRGLTAEEHDESRRRIEAAGCEINELTPEGQAAFVAAVKPQHDEARAVYGEAVFEMLEAARPK